MDIIKRNEAAGIITKNIITPVIYMVEDKMGICFLCFCDGKIKLQKLYDTKKELENLLGRSVELSDIRDFPVYERITLLRRAMLIHCENDFVREIFELSVAEDFRRAAHKRAAIMDREENCTSIYLN